MLKRNLYLKNTPVDEAQKIYMDAIQKIMAPKFETIPVIESLNRITKDAIYARCSSPHYNAAAMDGIAVNADKTNGASEESPLVLRPEDYVSVNTGNQIFDPCNAVIMAEDTMELEDGCLKITSSAAPWQHIRPIGEDIVVGEMIIPSCHRIRAIDIGVLLEAGIMEVEVVKLPVVGIFPSGSEIVEPSPDAKPGQIVDSNSRMFENMVVEEGGIAHRYPVLKDDYDIIKNAISSSVKMHDLVIINAGTSAGTKDYTVHVLRDLGEVLVHGVSVKPGKPCILAIVDGTPVIGLPGYPVSAYIGFTNFVTPLLKYLGNQSTTKLKTVKAVISRRLVSSLKYREYIRVKVGRVDDRIIAAPLARGAGAAMSLVRADGFCIVPQSCEGYEAGEEVEISLYRNLEEVENTAVLIGSHDLILDQIADIMANSHKNQFVSSTHVGSMAGLMSLRRKETHMAPIHLLDEATGEYNVKYVKSMFKEPMALIKGVDRIQGLLVQKGNPLNIQSIEDIVGKRYVNRQRGAGTRVLFDYKLSQLGIAPEQVNGYDHEMNTHMAVAVAVQSGSADVGMGILSAANAMGLDFIEVGLEEYDFAIPQKYLELPIIQSFIEILKSDEFHQILDQMGGYGYKRSGEVVLL